MATELREPIDLPTFEPPDYFLQVRRQSRIELSSRHPLYAAIIGLVLDLFDVTNGNPAHVAVNLGVSTTAVIRLLEDEPHAWAKANEIRARNGLAPMSHRS